MRVSCVGISDRRTLGACAASTFELCKPDHPATRMCSGGLWSPFGDDPCVCLTLEDPERPGTFFDWGWATLEDTCRRYRDLYPDQVRCRADDWAEVP